MDSKCSSKKQYLLTVVYLLSAWLDCSSTGFIILGGHAQRVSRFVIHWVNFLSSKSVMQSWFIGRAMHGARLSAAPLHIGHHFKGLNGVISNPQEPFSKVWTQLTKGCFVKHLMGPTSPMTWCECPQTRGITDFGNARSFNQKGRSVHLLSLNCCQHCPLSWLITVGQFYLTLGHYGTHVCFRLISSQ